MGGAPIRGMADRLLPVVGVPLSAAGVAEHYRELIAAWVVDDVDAAMAPTIERSGLLVGLTDSIMVDDDAAERVARTAIDLVHPT